MIKPPISLGGRFGQELARLWDALISSRIVSAPGYRVNQHRGGITLAIESLTGNNPSAPRLAYIQGETLHWLKCQFPEQLESEQYIWVAKPPALRCDTPPTSATYEDVTWGEPFTGERFIYRNANERLRLFSLDYAGTVRISLTQILTGYEKWPSQANAADVATYLSANRYTSKLGLVDWIYHFQTVYPTYGTFAPVQDPVPAIGWTDKTFIVPLDSNDLPSEVPEDETFTGPFYLDLNVNGRQWVNAAQAMVKELAIYNLGGAGVFGAGITLPQQYTDQTHNNTTPQLKTLLPSFWPELQT